MPDQILINYEALGGLAAQSDETLEALRQVAQPAVEMPMYSPKTLDGIDDFQGEWDEKRGKLITSLEAVTQALTNIASSFEELDNALAAGIRGES